MFATFYGALPVERLTLVSIILRKESFCHVFLTIFFHRAINIGFQRFYSSFCYSSFCFTSSRVNFDFLVSKKFSKLTTKLCSLIKPYFRLESDNLSIKASSRHQISLIRLAKAGSLLKCRVA